MSEPTIQDKFKRIEDGLYERDPNAMWTDAELIMSFAKAIMRRIENERKKK